MSEDQFPGILDRIASDFGYHPPSSNAIRDAHEHIRATLKSAARSCSVTTRR